MLRRARCECSAGVSVLAAGAGSGVVLEVGRVGSRPFAGLVWSAGGFGAAEWAGEA